MDKARETVLTAGDITRLRVLNVVGLQILSRLEKMNTMSSSSPSVTLITCLAAFTDPSDAWSTDPAALLANDLLKTIRPVSPGEFQVLLNAILSERVKPLFAKSKNPAITPAGRKAIDPLPGNFTHIEDEAELYPWRYKDIYILTVLQWIVQNLEVCFTLLCQKKKKMTNPPFPPFDPPFLSQLHIIDKNVVRIPYRLLPSKKTGLFSFPPSSLSSTVSPLLSRSEEAVS